MLVPDTHFYTLADREFYEPIERFQAELKDFFNQVRPLLPGDWEVVRGGVWFHCMPPNALLPAQGWKIHLSATLANSAAVVTTAARILVARGVAFKFAADKTMLALLNTKRWPRGGAGKFITIYPVDTTQCGELLECLHHEMIGYQGAYILSDRRYRDSAVVQYRYGGIVGRKKLDIRGRNAMVMEAPDGQIVQDERNPFFNLPEGMADPFVGDAPACDQEDDPYKDGTLKQGRYLIEEVVVFSNTGGVYLGVDQTTGQKVIIKEARPCTNMSPRGTDAVWLLKKEYRLLKILEDTRVAPRPLDFFQDWEHYYLVEEYLEGMLLRLHIAQYTIGLRVYPSREDAEKFYARYTELYARIGEILHVLHERRIVFTDVSHYNVMVMRDGEEIRLIDFEGAYEQGVDVPTLLYTPGFAPRQQLEDGGAQPEDDCYGLGGLMQAGLAPTNGLLALDPKAHERFLQAWTRDFDLPPNIAQCVRGLMEPDRSRRMGLEQAVRILREERTIRAPEIGTWETDSTDCDELLKGMVAYIDSTATPERSDRLFPADPAVFETNPLSVAHGACGVAYALHRITGRVRPEVLDWILRHPLTTGTYAPGLYMGLSGIAWTLLELGLRERAEEVAKLTHEHPLLQDSPDLFYGAAGWGMTQLRFFRETGNELYLVKAREAGDFLVATRTEEEGACWWPSHEGVCCGLAHGASGVSLYLLYLYLATGDEHYLEIGQRGLEFVVGKGLRTEDAGLTWRAKEGQPTHTPYWRWGSAGVGITLLRYQKALGDRRYASVLDDIFIDNDRKYTIFPTRFFGLAGMGEFLLDWAELTQDRQRALNAARKVLSGILLFRLDRPRGVAFSGETLTRITCDYGAGSAGIALFVHRLLNGGRAAFMLDDLLPGKDRLGLGDAGVFRPRDADLVLRTGKDAELVAGD